MPNAAGLRRPDRGSGQCMAADTVRRLLRLPQRLHAVVTDRGVRRRPLSFRNRRLDHNSSAFPGDRLHPCRIAGQTMSNEARPGPVDDGASLWAKITSAYQRAQDQQAAYQTGTTVDFVADAVLGEDFIIRVATALRDKPKPPTDKSGNSQEKKNPFLPYEEKLWVAHLSNTHTLLLNKFNVVPHHLLVVTRAFEAQHAALTEADLQATWTVMQAMPGGGLAYFNCGNQSGASQPHKHVQVVPLPLAEGIGSELPFARVIDNAWAKRPHSKCRAAAMLALPFRSYCSVLPDGSIAACELADITAELLMACTMEGGGESGFSYNVILTRHAAMLVPRSAETAGPVSVNSMGYAGSFFVRSQSELDFLRAEGPMNVLARTGQPWPA